MFAPIPAIEAALRQNLSARPDAPRVGPDQPVDPWEVNVLQVFRPECHQR